MVLTGRQALINERARKGLDKSDEMWNGELHMVPPPSYEHQHLGAELFLVLAPLAKARGLPARYHGTGVYRPGSEGDWRVPDHVYARPEHRSARGIEGHASLVVEILSPGDETSAKLGWYASVGVEEVLVVDPATRRVELLASRGGAMVAAEAVVITALGVTADTVQGSLHLSWEGGSADI